MIRQYISASYKLSYPLVLCKEQFVCSDCNNVECPDLDGLVPIAVLILFSSIKCDCFPFLSIFIGASGRNPSLDKVR